MTAGHSQEYASWSVRSRAFWLPPGGTGNGLAAPAWAPLADVSELLAFQAIGALAGAGVARYTAPRDSLRPRTGPTVYRLWVGSDHYTAAEDVLRRLLTR